MTSSDRDHLFILAPFIIEGETIEFNTKRSNPHSQVFGAIAAMLTLLELSDEGVKKIKHDLSVITWQALFNEMQSEFATDYVFNPTEREYILSKAFDYLESFSDEWLKGISEFSKANPPSDPVTGAGFPANHQKEADRKREEAKKNKVKKTRKAANKTKKAQRAKKKSKR